MGVLYKQFIRKILFSADPESAHDRIIHLGSSAAAFSPARSILRGLYDRTGTGLERTVCGLTFKNPIGLAAGFDKNAKALNLLSSMGFGFIEIGTVTPRPQPGNPKPRIFRYENDEALINRMGFPSDGADVVAERLSQYRLPTDFILGINIGKNKETSLEYAAQDYRNAFLRLKEFGHYFVVNVSSPNTPELRKLQEKARLLEIFGAIQSENNARKPLLVKLSPDLTLHELDELLGACMEAGIQGIIATNTTISREGLSLPTQEAGGLSGKPLFKRSWAMIRNITERTQGKIPLIASGGIMSGQNAADMISAGASLVQVYTGFIYNGPGFISELKSALNLLSQQHSQAKICVQL